MDRKKRHRSGSGDASPTWSEGGDKRACKPSSKEEVSVELFFGYPATVSSSEDLLRSNSDVGRQPPRPVNVRRGSSANDMMVMMPPDSSSEGSTLNSPRSDDSPSDYYLQHMSLEEKLTLSHVYSKDKASKWHEFRMRTIPEFSLDERKRESPRRHYTTQAADYTDPASASIHLDSSPLRVGQHETSGMGAQYGGHDSMDVDMTDA